MRVLWIAYAALGRAAQLIENSKSESGSWIDAMRSNIGHYDITLAIACVSSQSKKIEDMDGTVYYGISGITKTFGKNDNAQEIDKWKGVIDDFDPDVIMIWGSEWGNGERIITAADKIPVVIFIQGVLGRIVEYPTGLVSKSDLMKYATIFTRIKWKHYLNINKKQHVQAQYERKMVSLSQGVVIDNEWSNSYYTQCLRSNKIFYVPLPLNPIYTCGRHSMDHIEKYSVFSIACNNPSKGIHNLIKALAIVKQKYPTVKLYLPGSITYRKPGFLYKQPYLEYLDGLITFSGLKENVVFCGLLSPEEMKQHILTCNVYVMPSCIENHSSSLREAMYLGAPCISSEVGSVHEFVTHNNNGLLYRYEEYEVLADEIVRVFADRELAIRLGDSAYTSIRNKYPQDRVGDMMVEVYKRVIIDGNN